jgi:signal transduction histidine kinase
MNYRPVVQARTWLIAAYLLVSIVTGTFWFVVLTAGVAVGVPLSLIYVGLLILAALPVLARFGARAERIVVRAVFDIDIPAPYRRSLSGSRLHRARIAVADPATWKDVAYLVLLFPLGTIWSAIVAAVVGQVLSLAALPLYFFLLPDRRVGWLAVGNFTADAWWKIALACVIGLALAAPAAWIIRGIGYVHRAIAKGLLGATQTQIMAAQALRLRESRDHAVEAAAAERRRIERDLHDGAQQRLTALVMDLAIARSKFKTDPAAAEPFVARAHGEAKRAIVELRDLARGLHPAMLTERGLDAALSALAGRSPVPVDIEVHLDRRPPPGVESAIYFVISEALTNLAKHAQATRARVAVHLDAGHQHLVATVRDDGAGGAQISPGGGLAGLQTRVALVGGTLDVSSPAGGPTIITAEVPCAS